MPDWQVNQSANSLQADIDERVSAERADKAQRSAGGAERVRLLGPGKRRQVLGPSANVPAVRAGLLPLSTAVGLGGSGTTNCVLAVAALD
jgi:hypothetical protein